MSRGTIALMAFFPFHSAPLTLWQKMNPPPAAPHTMMEGSQETENWWEDDDDDDDDLDGVDPNVIFDNSEWGGCVLMAETATASLVSEDILGKILHSTMLTVSGQSFQFRKLSMNFVPFRLRATQTTSETTHVIINDIVRLKMIDWFHPLYQKV